MRHIVLIITMAFIAGFIGVGQGLAGGEYGHGMGSEGGAMMGDTHRSMMSSHSLDHNQIRELQNILNRKGYNSGPSDGILGPMTHQALRSFQESEGLAVTGTPDKTTLQALAPDYETQEFFGLSPGFSEDGMQQKEMMHDQMQQKDMMHDQMQQKDMMHDQMQQKDMMHEGQMPQEPMRKQMEESSGY